VNLVHQDLTPGSPRLTTPDSLIHEGPAIL
jgi:hypothetical protein